MVRPVCAGRKHAAPTPRRARLCAAGAVLVLLLAGCGSSAPRSPARTTTATRAKKAKPPQVDFYAGLPLHGPRAAQGKAVLAGIELALAQHHQHAGSFLVKLVRMDDTALVRRRHHRASYMLSPLQTARNARRAAVDPAAVLYIGDLDSKATRVSLPVLNLAGIAQITPGSPYIGLTQAVKGATGPSEPQIYRPSGSDSLVRLIPDDLGQARAQLLAMQSLCLSHVIVISQSDQEDVALATLVAQYGKTYKLDVSPPQTKLPSKLSELATLVASFAHLSPNCFVLEGTPTSTFVALTNMLHASYPKVRIFGSASLCNSAWTDPKRGGVLAAVDSSLYCTNPILPLDQYSTASSFSRAYRAMYPGSKPTTYALYGYVAANLGLAAVRDLGPRGDDRSDVLATLIDNQAIELGRFGALRNGTPTLYAYGLWRVDPAKGTPELAQVIDLTRSP